MSTADVTARLGEFFVLSDEMIDTTMHHAYRGCRWHVDLPWNPDPYTAGIPVGLMAELAQAHLAECREWAPQPAAAATS